MDVVRRPVLEISFPDGPTLIGACYDHGGRQGLEVEYDGPVCLGTPIRLDVRIQDGPRRSFHLLGRLANWKPGAGPDDADRVAVEIAPVERDSFRHLLRIASGRAQVFELPRFQPRAKARLRVVVRARHGRVYEGTTVDLGPGGMCIEGRSVPAPGEQVEARVKLGLFGGHVSVAGRVVWALGGPTSRMGIAFLGKPAELPAALRKRLAKLVGAEAVAPAS